MKAAIRGVEIYFDIAGMQLAPSGKDFVKRPVLFMLHGGPGGNHLRFKRHSAELQTVAQMVFIDHRGCGLSKKTKMADYTIENNIEDIEALRKHLGLEKICMLGTSYGGMVAQGYAIRYPKRVEKLVLVATSPSYRFMEEAKKNLQVRGNSEQIAMSKLLWNGAFKSAKQVEEYFEVMETLYSYKAKHSRKKLRIPSDIEYSFAALNKGFGDFLRSWDVIPKLKKIKCPTLILVGQEDWICSPNQARTMAKHIPQAQLKIFRRCGHSVAIDAHDRYIKAIKSFLRNA